MITEGYFAKVKDYPETDWLLCVSLKYPWFVKRDRMGHFDRLAPSKALLSDWKSGGISWEDYEKRFREEMTHMAPERDLAYLGLKDAHGETVRLLCWEKNPPCHRFILLDMIQSSSGSRSEIRFSSLEGNVR